MSGDATPFPMDSAETSADPVGAVEDAVQDSPGPQDSAPDAAAAPEPTGARIFRPIGEIRKGRRREHLRGSREAKSMQGAKLNAGLDAGLDAGPSRFGDNVG